MSQPCSCGVSCGCDPVFQNGSAPPPPQDTPIYHNVFQTVTAYCPDGTTGASKTSTVAAGVYVSLISQNDADNLAYQAALAAATAQLSCTTPPPTTYHNAQQVVQCPSGPHNNPATYPAHGDPVTVLAGVFSSNISQLNADTAAITAGTSCLSCQGPTTYYNAQQQVSCPGSAVINPATYPANGNPVTVPANLFTSQVSQQDADTQAINAGNGALICTVYYNAQQTVQCPSGPHNLPVTYPNSGDPVTVPAATFTSIISQADADSQAVTAGTAKLNCNAPGGNLNQLFWQQPHNGGAYTPDPADQTETMTGTPGQLYQVTMRFRGVIELKLYQTSPFGPYVHPMAASGEVGIACNYTGPLNAQQEIWYASGTNEYTLAISDPPQVIILNNLPLSGFSAIQPQLVDFTIQLQIRAGATVTLRMRSIDGHEWNNPPYEGMAPWVIPTPPALNPAIVQPYSGQILELDVLGVV